MASNEVPTQSQAADDNTPQWMKDVKSDADYNYRRIVREQAEREAHEKSKAEQQKNDNK